ncbi:MAG TPA: prepilin-type N-terminal cleavage/methylation domain-containing protein [Candidatus Paceibacterota bacterium]|nr:prepilin-type N-terminal cleavage/methylation domain-containing protein [Candidatus Paceibacterota bacterium]
MREPTTKRATGEANARRAFTLVETLVAIAILALAIAGPLYTADRTLVATELAREQLTATYLAQEGIEYVRALRDNAYLSAYQAGGTSVSANAWSAFLSSPVSQCVNSACTADPWFTPPGLPSWWFGTLQACTVGSTCTPLYFDGGSAPSYSGAIYSQRVTSVETPYTRTVQFYAVSPNDERVVATVTWDFHGTTERAIVTDQLTPWQ